MKQLGLIGMRWVWIFGDCVVDEVLVCSGLGFGFRLSGFGDGRGQEGFDW